VFSSVRNQLVGLFSLITAAAIGFIYLYVVPQLNSSLTAEKLRRLGTEATEQSRALAGVIGDSPSQAELRRLVLRLSQRAGSRVTLLGVRDDGDGPRPAFVIADSEVERSAVAPAYPAASATLATGAATTAVERVGGQRIGQSAVALGTEGEPAWVTVVSEPLGEVDENVTLIKRQIVIGGAIALVLALAAGWFAARAHSRRLRRLEEAAEKVAEGDFATAIPVDSADEVGQLATTMNEMRERLLRLDSARKEFIANASHELRTPIFSLGGFVELLDEDDPDPAARAEFVRTMREQIERLTKLTTDLLDLSKLDADALALSAEPVVLGEVADRVAAEFEPAAETHGSRIEVERESDAVAAADAGRVGQILRILIDNALTHTPEGTDILIQAKLQQGEPTLTVRDSGPGVDPHVRDQVFERFVTADDTQGSGLGLAIARELARAMRGDIRLASRRGRNEFTLTLPAADRAEAHA
jgi:two-component system, OmpR family, sensor kinase